MLIDCDTCTVRGAGCSGCMMNALVIGGSRAAQRDGPTQPIQLTGAEQHAVEVFARAGLELEAIDQTIGTTPRSARRPRHRRHVA